MGKKVSPTIIRLLFYNKYKHFLTVKFNNKINYKNNINNIINLQKFINCFFLNFNINFYFILNNFFSVFKFNVIFLNTYNILIKYFYILNKLILFFIKKNFFISFIIKIFLKNIKYLDSLNISNYFLNGFKKNISYKQLINEIFLMFGFLVKGLKLKFSGRLFGVQRAYKEVFKLGTIPIQTFKYNISYKCIHILTKYGCVGLKIWILK